MEFKLEYLLGFFSLVVSGLSIVAFYLLKYFHNQVILKFDQLIDSVSRMNIRLEVHNEKLESGQKQFSKIEDHQKSQDLKIQQLSEEIIFLKTGLVKSERSSQL